MAGKYLGKAFDIHGGGVDLRFPHHENEQAQSRAAGHPFASYWMHNAWITTAGEKMSKSLGNSLTIPAVLDEVPRHRAALLPRRRALPQPRRVQLRGARGGGRRLPPDRGLPRARHRGARRDPGRRHRLRRLRHRDGRRPRHPGRGRRDPRRGAGGQQAARRRRLAPRSAAPPPRCSPCSTSSASRRTTRAGHGETSGKDTQLTQVVDALVAGLLEQRAEARANKDFAAADAIRDRIKAAGIEIEDTPTGPKWSLEAGKK